jgi:hypothetical protein
MLDLKQLDLQYVTDQTGKKTAVILSIENFQSLLADINDLAAIAGGHGEQTISHDELIAELKRDAVI